MGFSSAAEPRCDWCGAENPRWIRHIDGGPVGYAWRKLYGVPGPTSTAYRACEDCEPKMNAAFPPGSAA